MPRTTKGISPIHAANVLTPWWIEKIMEFDGLEIQPCAIIGYDRDGNEIAEPCYPAQAAYWTVYGHYRPGGVMGGVDAFKDFKTEGEAEIFHDRLIKAYPHLADEQPLPKQKKQDDLKL